MDGRPVHISRPLQLLSPTPCSFLVHTIDTEPISCRVEIDLTISEEPNQRFCTIHWSSTKEDDENGIITHQVQEFVMQWLTKVPLTTVFPSLFYSLNVHVYQSHVAYEALSVALTGCLARLSIPRLLDAYGAFDESDVIQPFWEWRNKLNLAIVFDQEFTRDPKNQTEQCLVIMGDGLHTHAVRLQGTIKSGIIAMALQQSKQAIQEQQQRLMHWLEENPALEQDDTWLHS